jgi:hypothetical protein
LSQERLDIGRVLRLTVNLVVENIWPLLGLTLVLWAIPNFLLLEVTRQPVTAWVTGLFPTHGYTTGRGWLSSAIPLMEQAWLSRLIAALRASIPGSVFRGATLMLLWRRLTGEPTDYRLIASRALARAPVVYVAFVVRGVVTFIGVSALIAPGAMVAVAMAVLIPVIVVEGPRGALRRATQLTVGSRWWILLLLVLFTVANGAFTIGQRELTQAIFNAGLELTPVLWRAVNWTLEIAPNLVGVAGAAALYYELRRLKEGAPDAADVFS